MGGLVVIFLYYGHVITATPRTNAASRLTRAIALVLATGTFTNFALLAEGRAGKSFLIGVALQCAALGYEAFCILSVIWNIVSRVLPHRFTSAQRVVVQGAILGSSVGAAVPFIVIAPLMLSMGDGTSPDFDVERYNFTITLGFSMIGFNIVFGSPVLGFLHYRVRQELNLVIAQRIAADSETSLSVRAHVTELRARVDAGAWKIQMLAPVQLSNLILLPVSYHYGWPVIDFIFSSVFGIQTLATFAILIFVKGKRRLLASEGSVMDEGLGRNMRTTAGNNQCRFSEARSMLDQFGLMDRFELDVNDMEALMGSQTESSGEEEAVDDDNDESGREGAFVESEAGGEASSVRMRRVAPGAKSSSKNNSKSDATIDTAASGM